MAQKSKRGNKYGAKKTGDHASKKEHGRAGELKLMEAAGIISNLREQVRFNLLPHQYGTCGTDFKGKEVKVLLERPLSYIADFVYEKDGQTIVEDTKGVRTEVYKIKRKLMLFFHGIRIKEI
ncbi:MAG: DUF1064 domain-containing protein [Muribaculaceae bacterium]|nr:DUF1064 domain-containing protein [Muribaculaceae bacterium]